MSSLMAPSIAPVEYAVAVDRYLAEAELGTPSQRVYRVSLAGWAWPLVGLHGPRVRAGGWQRRLSSRWLSSTARTRRTPWPRRSLRVCSRPRSGR